MTERRAALVSLENDGDEVRIRLDDVVAEQAGEWRQDVHVTHKCYDRVAIENISLSEKELADFGYFILARLNAISAK